MRGVHASVTYTRAPLRATVVVMKLPLFAFIAFCLPARSEALGGGLPPASHHAVQEQKIEQKSTPYRNIMPR